MICDAVYSLVCSVLSCILKKKLGKPEYEAIDNMQVVHFIPISTALVRVTLSLGVQMRLKASP